jgi:hypothetical protein
MSKAESARARGQCLCGAVSFAIRGPLRDVVVCHCDQCLHNHGVPPGYTSAAWRDIELSGEDRLRWFRSSAKARRGFCAECGASLFWEPVGEARVSINVGALDAPTGLKTVRHIFVAEKPDWDRIYDGLEELPGSMRS